MVAVMRHQDFHPLLKALGRGVFPQGPLEQVVHPVADVGHDLVERERLETKMHPGRVGRRRDVPLRVDEGAVEVEEDGFQGIRDTQGHLGSSFGTHLFTAWAHSRTRLGTIDHPFPRFSMKPLKVPLPLGFRASGVHAA
jgi:hypothetical protein